MCMSFEFTRNNIDHYLYEVAKIYKKANRAFPDAEIILIGGASVLLNYNFRDMTTDLDAILRASLSMKDAIKMVADNNGLESDWINEDFKHTKSYSPKIVQYSKFYKKFCGCLTVRTITDEYLLAMKLCSARNYKKDLSDIIGILKENEERNTPIDFTKINKAVINLYGSWDVIDSKIKDMLIEILDEDNLEDRYYSTLREEKINKQALLLAQEKYPEQINDKNAALFTEHFKSFVEAKEDNYNQDDIEL